jgi:hypothetical protein
LISSRRKERIAVIKQDVEIYDRYVQNEGRCIDVEHGKDRMEQEEMCDAKGICNY